ncbi:MAG: interleukin-like EMT inducer domain-containing protein, partial [Candidatus Omnitrophota bacterium]
MIDDVSVWHRVLDENEIKYIYEGTPISGIAGYDTDCTAWWKFDDALGVIAADEKGAYPANLANGAEFEKRIDYEIIDSLDLNSDGFIDGSDLSVYYELLRDEGLKDARIISRQEIHEEIYHIVSWEPEGKYYVYYPDGQVIGGLPGDPLVVDGIPCRIAVDESTGDVRVTGNRLSDINKDGWVDSGDEAIIADLDNDSDVDNDDFFLFSAQNFSADHSARKVELNGKEYYLLRKGAGDNIFTLVPHDDTARAIVSRVWDKLPGNDTILYDVEGVDYIVRWAENLEDIILVENIPADLDKDGDVDFYDWVIMEPALGTARRVTTEGVGYSDKYGWHENLSYGDPDSVYAIAGSYENWVEYEIDIMHTGSFDIKVLVKNDSPYRGLPGGYIYAFDVYLDGAAQKTGTIYVNGDNSTYVEGSINLANIAEGAHTLRLVWANADAAWVPQPDWAQPHACLKSVTVESPYDERADIDSDGVVDARDLEIFTAAFSDTSMVQKLAFLGKTYYVVKSKEGRGYTFYGLDGTSVTGDDKGLVTLEGVAYKVTAQDGVISLFAAADVDGSGTVNNDDRVLMEQAMGTMEPAEQKGDDCLNAVESGGTVDGYLRFYGTSEEVVSAPRNVLHGLGDFSITMRVKSVSGGTQPTLISAYQSTSMGSTDVGMKIWYYSWGRELYLDIGKTTVHWDNIYLTGDSWKWITVRRQGTSYRLYINGVDQGAQDYIYTYGQQGVPLNIPVDRKVYLGAEESYTPGTFLEHHIFGGYISDVSIWSRGLSGSEVASLHSGAKPDAITDYATQCRAWWDFADGQENVEKDRTTNGYDLTISGVTAGPAVAFDTAFKFDHAGESVYAEPTAVTGVVYNAVYEFSGVQGSGNYDIGLDARNYASGLFPVSGIEGYKFDVTIDGIYKGRIEVPASRSVYRTGYINTYLEEGDHTVTFTWLNPEEDLTVEIGRVFLRDAAYLVEADLNGDGIITEEDRRLFNRHRINGDITQLIRLDGRTYYVWIDPSTGQIVLDDGEGHMYTNLVEGVIEDTIKIPLVSDPSTIITYDIKLHAETSAVTLFEESAYLVTLLEENDYDFNADGSFDAKDRDILKEAMNAKLTEKDANNIRDISTGWQFNADDTISHDGASSPWVEYLIEVDKGMEGDHFAGLSFRNDTEIYPPDEDEVLTFDVYLNDTRMGEISVPWTSTLDTEAYFSDALKMYLTEGEHRIKFVFMNDSGADTAVRVSRVFFTNLGSTAADLNGDYAVTSEDSDFLFENVGVNLSGVTLKLGDDLYEATAEETAPGSGEYVYTLRRFTDDAVISTSDPGARTVDIADVRYNLYMDKVEEGMMLAVKGILSIPVNDGVIEFKGVEYEYEELKDGLFKFTRTTPVTEASTVLHPEWSLEVELDGKEYGIIQTASGKIILVPAERERLNIIAASYSTGGVEFYKNGDLMDPGAEVSGDYRNYLEFTGDQSSYAETAGAMNGLADFTVNFCVKPEPGNPFATILGESEEGQTDGGRFSIILGTEPSYEFVNLRLFGGSVTFTNGLDKLLDGEWHWLTVTRDADVEEMKLYIDGELVGTDTADHAGPAGQMIVSNTTRVGRDFGGGISEMSVWGEVLSPGNIQSMHSEYTEAQDIQGFSTDCRVLWDFLEGQGSTLTDKTANGFDGTVYSANWQKDNEPVCLVNGTQVPSNSWAPGEGINIIVIDEDTGHVAFTSWDADSSVNVAAMTAYLRDLSEDTIIVAAKGGDMVGALDENAYLALESFGSARIRSVQAGDTWCMIGYMGAPEGSVEEGYAAGDMSVASGPVYVKDGPHFTSYYGNTRVKIDGLVYAMTRDEEGRLYFDSKEEFESYVDHITGEQKVKIDEVIYDVLLDMNSRPTLVNEGDTIREDGRGIVIVDGRIYKVLPIGIGEGEELTPEQIAKMRLRSVISSPDGSAFL